MTWPEQKTQGLDVRRMLTFLERWKSSRKEPSFEKTLAGLEGFELDFDDNGVGVDDVGTGELYPLEWLVMFIVAAWHVCSVGVPFPHTTPISMPPNINLKQRLAALSLSPSSPTTPYAPVGQPRSPHSAGKRKLLFTPPWGKRSVDRILTDDQDARDRVQDVMSRVVFQAGVDFELVQEPLLFTYILVNIRAFRSEQGRCMRPPYHELLDNRSHTIGWYSTLLVYLTLEKFHTTFCSRKEILARLEHSSDLDH
jgi:hypothetical protein